MIDDRKKGVRRALAAAIWLWIAACIAGGGVATAADGPRHFDYSPGWHEYVSGHTLVEYYVPRSTYTHALSNNDRQLLVLVHGAGDCHVRGANTNIQEWKDWANIHNVIIVAPVFDRIYPNPMTRTTKWLPESKRSYDERLLRSPQAYAMLAKCKRYAHYRKKGRLPKNFNKPDSYLHGFHFLINKSNVHRSDLVLNEIVQAFQNAYSLKERTFSLYGYSGGGQFVSRYMMLYPEKLKRVALGGAGSLLFPLHEPNYPFGLSCHYPDDIEVSIWGRNYTNEKTRMGLNSFFRKSTTAPLNWADFITRLTPADWDRKIAKLLDLKIYIFAGNKDFLGAEDHAASLWQGYGQRQKAENFVVEMLRADQRLKKMGYRRFDAPFACRLITFSNRDHKQARGDAVKWLQSNWW